MVNTDEYITFLNFTRYCVHALRLKIGAGGRTPVHPVARASRMLRGLMLGRVQIFWARADV